MEYESVRPLYTVSNDTLELENGQQPVPLKESPAPVQSTFEANG